MGYTKTKKFCCWFGIQISPGVLCLICNPTQCGQKPPQPCERTGRGLGRYHQRNRVYRATAGKFESSGGKPENRPFSPQGRPSKAPQAKMGQGVGLQFLKNCSHVQRSVASGMVGAEVGQRRPGVLRYRRLLWSTV